MGKSLTNSKKIKYFFALTPAIIFMAFLAFKNKGSEISPLVYLIPENYFGPVFVFFGQKDGVEMLPDPLGQAVLIPENGVVKIKKDMDAILPRKKPDYQSIYWISISKDGIRKRMIINENTMEDNDGNLYEEYYDENGIPHKNPTGNGQFEYFSEKQKNENMIFGDGGCGQNNFIPENDSTAKSPACGNFLVISPNAYITLPKWMWRSAHHSYGSIQQLVDESNKRLEKKKLFYDIP